MWNEYCNVKFDWKRRLAIHMKLIHRLILCKRRKTLQKDFRNNYSTQIIQWYYPWFSKMQVLNLDVVVTASVWSADRTMTEPCFARVFSVFCLHLPRPGHPANLRSCQSMSSVISYNLSTLHYVISYFVTEVYLLACCASDLSNTCF